MVGALGQSPQEVVEMDHLLLRLPQHAFDVEEDIEQKHAPRRLQEQQQ